MKKTLGIVALALALVFCGRIAMAADKIGLVDLAKLLDEYGKTKDYDTQLNSKVKAFEAEREKKVNEIKQLQEKYNLLNEKEREAKKPELETKVKSLKDFDEQRQGELLKERETKMKEIVGDIEKAVQQYGAAQGYTMIIDDRVVVFQGTGLEVTDKVLEILKGSYKGK